jgi:hypothetical protein
MKEPRSDCWVSATNRSRKLLGSTRDLLHEGELEYVDGGYYSEPTPAVDWSDDRR